CGRPTTRTTAATGRRRAVWPTTSSATCRATSGSGCARGTRSSSTGSAEPLAFHIVKRFVAENGRNLRRVGMMRSKQAWLGALVITSLLVAAGPVSAGEYETKSYGWKLEDGDGNGTQESYVHVIWSKYADGKEIFTIFWRNLETNTFKIETYELPR